MTMRVYHPASTALALLLAWVAAPACQSAAPPAEPQAAAVDPAREAIAVYSASIEQVEPLRAAFVTTWESAVQFDDVAGLVDAVRGKAIPSFDALRSAVRAMPTHDEDLAEVHRTLVEAYDQFDSALLEFTNTLKEDSRQRPVETLIAELGALAAREKAYREQLEAYYRSHDVTFEAQEQASEANGPSDAPAPADPAQP